MPVTSTAQDWLAARFAPGLTDTHLRALVDASGVGSTWAMRASDDVARKLGFDVRTALAHGARDPRVAATLAWLAADDQFLLTLDDAGYPAVLRELRDPPCMLFAKGRPELLGGAALAIVGSRNPTALGEQTAEAFARALAQAGLTVVSGLALGIDAAAHRGALDTAASTVAIVGTGLDIVYPTRNRELAQRIAAQGCLLSEYPLGTPARTFHFPRRNRLLAGLTLGCLVVEANLRSGSLITAQLAGEFGREVFAIPGSIHSPLAKGCHALIRQGARLTESAADILSELAGPLGRLCAESGAARLRQPSDIAGGADNAPGRTALSSTARALLATLTHAPISVDALSARLGWSAGTVSAALLELELAGLAAPGSHATWQRLAPERDPAQVQ